MAQQPLVGKGCLIIEDSRLHSVGLFQTSDQPGAETGTWQHNADNRQTSIPPAGFEPTIPARERPQIHTLDRAATGVVIS